MFFHLTWFGSVITNHHCHGKEVRRQELQIFALNLYATTDLIG